MMKIVLTDDRHAQTPELDQVVSVGAEPVAMSYYDRSQQGVNGFTAAFLRENARKKAGASIPFRAGWTRCSAPAGDWKGRYARRDAGHEVFYHGMLTSQKLGRNIFSYEDEKELDGIVYSYLMENYDLRILPEWAPALTEELRKGSGIKTGEFRYCFGDNSAGEKLFGGRHYVLFPEWLREERIEKAVGDLLRGGRIRIPGARRDQLPMEIKDLDSYLKSQGSTLAENLQQLLKSHVGLDDEVENLAFRDFSLYRQQALMVNGAVRMLGKKKSGKSRYCFLSMDMGTGKTATAVSIVEKFEGDRYLRTHSDVTFRELLCNEDLLRYRVMVLAPGHLLEKWKREIEERVVFAKVEIIRDFSQLTKLRERGKPTGREYYIISKDFAKLDYQEQPVPSRIRYNAPVRSKQCAACGTVFQTPGRICPSCGCADNVPGENDLYMTTGLMCPECGNVLIPYTTLTADRMDMRESLMPEDFARPTTHNLKCWHCDTELWQPYVRNLKIPWWAVYRDDYERKHESEILAAEEAAETRKAAWKRITVVRNKGTGKTETLWAHKKYQKSLIESAVSERKDNDGCRKVAPGGYIKKYLHFDFLIADEAHEYKGATAQGEVFSALCSVSDRILALTGTITGGKASDLFYLLWRLDPARMVKDGFKYTDVIGFSYRYGKVVRELKFDDGATEVGTASRNVRYSSPRVEPGISPLVYPKFLHDRQVALNLTDMSANLPELKEKVITVKPDSEEQVIRTAYEEVIDLLKTKSREQGMHGLLSTMLQFSLSYLDRPYTEERKFIYDPAGDPVCTIPQFDFMRSPGRLSSKEKALVEDVREQLGRGRNCVIYCEYTASPDTCITDRLRTILERETGERVEILRASSPAPSEREAYMRRLTEEGTRVWITNPRCTETGLDFIWKKDGVTYNFPTIINYQLGYSLPVVMQSTRRHYRLIQTEECETHYICWDDTIETAVLKVIASKQMAHSSVQGKFSAEGLAAMMDGTDGRKEIFNALMKSDSTSGADLQGMFDVIASRRKADSASNERRMPTVRDILGDELYEETFERKTGFVYASDEDGEADFGIFDIF